ncbi:MAG TPA: S8 family serine peptidase, partial [Limnochordales bacterium]
MKRLSKATHRFRPHHGSGVLLFLLAVLLTGCFGWGLGDERDTSGTFSLQGIVVVDGTDTPVGGAVVRVGNQETTTAPDGTFAFSQIRITGSSMAVAVEAPGFRSATLPIHPAPDDQLFITIPLVPDGPDGGSGGPGGGDGTDDGDGSGGSDNNGDTGGPGGTDGGGAGDGEDGTGGHDGSDEPGHGPGDGQDEEPLPVYSGVVEAQVRLVNANANASPATVAGVSLPAELLDRSTSASVVRTTAARVPGEWIVQLNGDYPVQAVHDMWAEAGVQVIERLPDNFYLVAATEAGSEAEVEQRLAMLPNVVSVEPNQRVQPVAVPYVPNDPYFYRQWGLPMVSVPYAWGVTTGSREVVVAVLDTGILPQHPDLAGVKIVHGRNFASDQSSLDYTDDATDLSHGTMVAGIIGAMTNNGVGIAGINWNVSIMPVRVMSSRSGGTVAAVGQGIRWAVDNGAHVINMSLAWDASYNNTFVNQQIEYAASKGVVLVAGAGNDSGRITMPASHPDVIAVGAVDRNKRITWYSNYGSQLELVAPGGDTRGGQTNGILSTDIVNGRLGYSYQQGTSFAAPHVTGIVALMYSAGITDADEIRQLLRHTAEDLG